MSRCVSQAVRGTHDVLPRELYRRIAIERTASDVAHQFGFQQIETPILEHEELFRRTLGSESDVVMKEMYTLEDMSGGKLVLRPENTAGVSRAFLNAGLIHEVPQKWFYHGPMFRYERPQKGRLRQFHQFGIEFIGATHSFSDVEVIDLANTLLNRLGIQSSCSLRINSLGDEESRNRYSEVLKDFFNGQEHLLSPESQNRLKRGSVLRILDSKSIQDRTVLQSAPSLDRFLSDASRRRFEAVLEGLSGLGIQHTVDRTLVRGLDYYSDTCFEFVSDSIGSQSAVIAGGRYDGLISQLGGSSPVPSVGWAAGLERLSLLCSQFDTRLAPSVDVVVVHLSDRTVDAQTKKEIMRQAQAVLHDLRQHRICSSISYKTSMKEQLKLANKIGAKCAVIVGEEELKRCQVSIKDLRTGIQSCIDQHCVSDKIKQLV
eukprot:GILK01004654.1.p1 GENE.GILK01004654.1~~GILK01004654.1.p1  ORF type:complete len:431 (-),score=45.44 GILK01004654.1:95-1387(-)